MSRLRRKVLIAALSMLVVSTKPASTDEPTRPAIADADIEKALANNEWYGVYVFGRKIGYAHVTVERFTDNGHSGIREVFDLSVKISALGRQTEMRVHGTEEFEAKPPYRFLRATMRQSDGKSTEDTTLELVDGRFRATVSAGDSKARVIDVDHLDYTLADALAPEVWIRSAPKVGDELTHRSLDIEKLRVTTGSAEFKGTTTRTVDGVRMTVYDVVMIDPELRMRLPSVIDENGRMLSTRMGGLMEMRLEPEQLAKDTEFSADLFEHGVIRLNKPLGAEARNVDSLELEVVGGEGLTIASGSRQRFESAADSNQTVLRLGAKFGKPVPATDEEIGEHLKETVRYPIREDEIVNMAREAVRDAPSDAERIKRLLKFVSDYIVDSYSADQLTVADIVKHKRGDCTEHALLFTTLARASGFPAREVGGLVYMGDESKAFGPHAWCEVVVNGNWVHVDPAWDEFEINATHISFGSAAGDHLQLFARPKGISFRLLAFTAGNN